MAEYIEREALREAFIKHFDAVYDDGKLVFSDHICTAEDCEDILKLVAELPTADVVPVVRCCECVHSKKLDKHCELNTDYYLHCKLYRGEEEKNVWHKYKKYFADYSLVAIDDYCSYGERKDNK